MTGRETTSHWPAGFSGLFSRLRDGWFFHSLLQFTQLSSESFGSLVDTPLLSDWQSRIRLLPNVQVTKWLERLGVAITNNGAVLALKRLRTRPYCERILQYGATILSRKFSIRELIFRFGRNHRKLETTSKSKTIPVWHSIAKPTLACDLCSSDHPSTI